MEITKQKVLNEEEELRELVNSFLSDKSSDAMKEIYYTRFYHKCKNVFESVLYKTTFDKHLASTIYNDAIIIFREQAKKEIEIKNIKGFLYQIAINVYLNKIKPENKQKQRFSLLIDSKNSFLNMPDRWADEISEDEFEQVINWGLNELKKEKPHMEKVIRAFYIDELSYKEVSDNFGYSLNEVKSHVQNGKQNLKKIVERAEVFNKYKN